jgi:hypothetical protein
MKRIAFFSIAFVLGYLVIPQVADGLEPCCCRASCGWSCEPDPYGLGMWSCEQQFPKAVQNSMGEGIESSTWCGAVFIGEQCDEFAWTYCGGMAYTTAECDPGT